MTKDRHLKHADGEGDNEMDRYVIFLKLLANEIEDIGTEIPFDGRQSANTQTASDLEQSAASFSTRAIRKTSNFLSSYKNPSDVTLEWSRKTPLSSQVISSVFQGSSTGQVLFGEMNFYKLQAQTIVDS